MAVSLVLRDVQLNWCYLTKADNNGKYRVDIEVKKGSEVDKLLLNTMESVLKEKGKTSTNAGWLGSRKELDTGDMVRYIAKTNTEFTNKKGELVVNNVKLYDRNAMCFNLEQGEYLKGAKRANVAVDVFYSEYQKKFGAGLNLKSIQLIDFELGYFGDANPFEAVDGVDSNSNVGEDESVPF